MNSVPFPLCILAAIYGFQIVVFLLQKNKSQFFKNYLIAAAVLVLLLNLPHLFYTLVCIFGSMLLTLGWVFLLFQFFNVGNKWQLMKNWLLSVAFVGAALCLLPFVLVGEVYRFVTGRKSLAQELKAAERKMLYGKPSH